MAQDQLTYRLENKQDDLIKLMDAVEVYSAEQNLPPDAAYAATLVVEEIVYNTICYGCEEGQCAHIEVRMRVENGELHLEIEDDAHPFNPLQDAPQPEGLDGGEVTHEGGLGVYLVTHVMDDARYESKNGGNLLILRKTLATKESP